MTNVLRFVGRTWVVLAVALIVLSYGATWWSDGYLKLAQTLAPWNVGNWIAVVMALAPGWFLIVWADRIEARRELADRGL
jgi:hypothetical protein